MGRGAIVTISGVTIPLPVPPPGTELWWYLSAMTAAVLVIGIAKAGFGGGIGILAVPLVANAMPPERAIGVMLPLLIVADVFSNFHYVGKQSWPHLRWLLAGAAVGIGLGTVVLWWLREAGVLSTVLAVLVGGTCLLIVALQGWRLAGGKVARLPSGPWPGRIVGAVAGFTSTLSHSAGPIVSLYMLEERVDKTRHVGTLVMYFLLGNLAKVPSYVALAVLTPATLLEAAWFMPLIPVGTLMGVWMHRRVPEKPFAAVVYVGAAVAGAHLVWEAVV